MSPLVSLLLRCDIADSFVDTGPSATASPNPTLPLSEATRLKQLPRHTIFGGIPRLTRNNTFRRTTPAINLHSSLVAAPAASVAVAAPTQHCSRGTTWSISIDHINTQTNPQESLLIARERDRERQREGETRTGRGTAVLLSICVSLCPCLSV